MHTATEITDRQFRSFAPAPKGISPERAATEIRSELDNALDGLKGVISQHEEEIAGLYFRLNKVLRPAGPEFVSKDNKFAEPVADLTFVIIEVTLRITRASESLQDIKARLAL